MNLNSNQENFFKKLQRQVMPFIYRKDLMKLSTFYGTDKWNSHWYAQHYARHFAPLRLKKLKILEIGVGGYDNPKSGGESLRMWKSYFPNSMIYGIDVVDKTSLEEHRIKIFHGSQDDEDFLNKVVAETGELDIIIDDGSHVNEHVIKSFNILFPALKESGIYVVEDTLTSYIPNLEEKPLNAGNRGVLEKWPRVGGSLELDAPKTTMNFFKKLVDCLNYQEILRPGYFPSYFDKHIVAMHFYHNLIFIYKGNNNEDGYYLENNTIKPYLLKYLSIESVEELGI